MGAVLQTWWRGVGAGALALAGCTYPLPPDAAADTGEPPTGSGLRTYDVRGGGVQDGNQAVLRGVLVTSPVTPGEPAFFIQDEAGGASSGLGVRMVQGAQGPAVEVGDRVDVAGVVHWVGGRAELWVGAPRDVVVVGVGVPPVAHLAERPASWEPWLGATVSLSGLTVTGCPDATNASATDLGLPVGGPWARAPEAGDHLDPVAGVVGAVGAGHALWILPDQPPVVTPHPRGCTTSFADARARGLRGAVGVVAAVPVAPSTEDGLAWAQDPGGGPGAGLPVVGWKAGAAGGAWTLRGDLREVHGRLALDLSAAWPAGGARPVAARFDPGVDRWDLYAGTLVQIASLDVTAAGPLGSLETAEGLRLVPDLVGPLPYGVGAQTGPVRGVLDQWPDGAAVLVLTPAAR